MHCTHKPLSCDSCKQGQLVNVNYSRQHFAFTDETVHVNPGQFCLFMRHINGSLCTLGHSILNGAHPLGILNQHLDQITINRDSFKVKLYYMWILMASSISDTWFNVLFMLSFGTILGSLWKYMLRLLFHPYLNKSLINHFELTCSTCKARCGLM